MYFYIYRKSQIYYFCFKLSFYISNLLLPFQGQNNYYGAVAPAVGQTVADMDFNKAILRMDDSGFATEIADNC